MKFPWSKKERDKQTLQQKTFVDAYKAQTTAVKKLTSTLESAANTQGTLEHISDIMRDKD